MLKFNIPVTGIIENMSYFECDKVFSATLHIWRKSGKRFS